MFECCMSKIRDTVPSPTPPPQCGPACMCVTVRQWEKPRLLSISPVWSMHFVNCMSVYGNCLIHPSYIIALQTFTLLSSWRLIGSFVKNIQLGNTMRTKSRIVCYFEGRNIKLETNSRHTRLGSQRRNEQIIDLSPFLSHVSSCERFLKRLCQLTGCKIEWSLHLKGLLFWSGSC